MTPEQSKMLQESFFKRLTAAVEDVPLNECIAPQILSCLDSSLDGRLLGLGKEKLQLLLGLALDVNSLRFQEHAAEMDKRVAVMRERAAQRHAGLSSRRRVDIKAILSDPVKRRALFVPALIALQAREGITTTREQAEEAYDKVQAELAEKS
jgi:hypothetical protein